MKKSDPTTGTAVIDIFGIAKENGKTQKKTPDKLEVVIKGKDFDTSMKQLAAKREAMELLKTEINLLETSVREEGIKQYIQLYTEGKKNPGSFNLCSESNISTMFIPVEKFGKLDKDAFTALKKKYPTLVAEQTKYQFNSELLEKYLKVIGAALATCPGISDDDKPRLLVADTSYVYTEKVLDDALTISKGNLESFLSMIQPQYQLKNVAKKQIIKG